MPLSIRPQGPFTGQIRDIHYTAFQYIVSSTAVAELFENDTKSVLWE